MEFQIGDRVRIRPDLASCDLNELPYITIPMLGFAGREATIRQQVDHVYYLSEFRHVWLDKWLEHIEEDTQTEYEKLNLNSVL